MTPFVESFVFGAANSLHCACMCGPLTLGAAGSLSATATYQGGRATSYAILGAAIGATGTWLGSGRIQAPTAVVSYVLAAAIVVLALGGDRGAIRVPFLQGALRRVTTAGRAFGPRTRAALMGLATPLLPCGLLWSAFAAAAVSGSAVGGSMTMLGFALGSLPLLLLAQWRAPLLVRRLSPMVLTVVQRGAMLLAAGLLVWRGMQASHGGCCH